MGATASTVGSGLSTTGSLLVGLASAVVLGALHVLAPHIRRLPFIPERASGSFAGGLAVSYVFLHLLPELSAGDEHVAAVLGDESERTPLVGLEIFLVALVGFTAFYGLERMAHRSRREGGDEGAGAGAFRVHLASFVVYNAVIGYTLPLKWRTSISFALLFTVAIGLHFIVVDRSLESHHGDRFDRRWPRLALAGAVVGGLGLAALFAPTRVVVVSLLTAFVGGGVLLNVFKEELPASGSSHFGWFVAGLTLYAVLLGAVTMAGEPAPSAPPAEPVPADTG